MRKVRKMQIVFEYDEATLGGLGIAMHIGTASPNLLREYMRSVIQAHCQKLTSVVEKGGGEHVATGGQNPFKPRELL